MLEAKNISKSFPGVKALQNVNFTFYAGKVNAILGENGAGKSTLLKVLTGVYQDYEGDILLDGEKVTFESVKAAQLAGVGIIHQELNLIPSLSIAENIFLGNEVKNTFGVLNDMEMESRSAELLQQVNLNISPNTKVESLKVGEQQLVEIAKALLIETHVLLMDEPTSALTDKEIDRLHGIIAKLKAEGKAIVYISHKMDELFRIADTYTVLRDGQTVGAGEMSETTEANLISMMVGREVQIPPKSQGKAAGEVSLKVENLNLPHPTIKNRNLLDDINLELRKGEILGIFGLMGAGRTELLESIFGLNSRNLQGETLINGEQVKISSPQVAKNHGLAFLTEDRKSEGLVLGMDLSANIGLTTLKNGTLLQAGKEAETAKKYINELSIKTPSESQLAVNLSGGNQQKVVLAKWLDTFPEILMLDEPTRGIDINAKSEIYDLITKLAESGKSILLVSSEIPEILALSDRILVMAEGKITAEFKAGEVTEEMLLKKAI
ncbi:sugar ABC transporter ATP-binding protein [Jiulongibacter sediminis]|jgi:ribose transport system ATP-binding protein|uniref:sugar ABC transporter ATP-binding protein n=1 Tax=Jiulongibacter sediminis TaxID=1605367 RepID=UPI0026ED9B7D|nr:sugar ABC transporter ATP-binding protein [Jiulongibacter sediminis]